MKEEEKEKGILRDRPQMEESTSVVAGGGDVGVKDEVKVCEMNPSEVGGNSGGGDGEGNGDDYSSSLSGESVQHEKTGEDEAAATAPQLSREELLEAVRTRLEELFSLSSLKAGTFPAGNMNAQMCVPVDVVAQMSQIRVLTQDEDDIVEAAKGCSACIATPDGIRPNMRSERNTIILREIPSNTDSRRVEAIFKDAGMEMPVTVRSDVGDTWFVTFKSEDDAMKYILALRDHAFEGKPIKARLKSENLLRSIFPQTSTTNASGKNVVPPPLNTLPVPPSVINSQQQAVVMARPGAPNNSQAAIPATMGPYAMGPGPVQPQMGSLFTGQINRGPPASFSPGINAPFSTELTTPPRPLPGSPVIPQGGVSVGTYPSPVMDPYTMHNLLSYNMLPQRPLMPHWRAARMGGPLNPGLRVGHHNRAVSTGTISGGGDGKNGGRGRHFPNASLPGGMYRTPAWVFFNPMSGGPYSGKNANKAQPYQYGAGAQATNRGDRIHMPSRGLKSRNRGRGGGSMVDRGTRSHVGDTETGGNKLRGDTSSNDKAKQPDLSSSTHFPPLPGQDGGGDTAGGSTGSSDLGGGLSTGLGTGLGTSGGARLLPEQSDSESSQALSSFSDNALRERETSNEGDGDIHGSTCGKGSDGSESVPCAPPTSCTVRDSISASASGGGDNNLSHESKVWQNKRVEGDLRLEASNTSSTSTGDRAIPQADTDASASCNLQVSESTDQSEWAHIVSLPPSQEGPSAQTHSTTLPPKQQEEVKCVESQPVFGAYAAALMKNSQVVNASNPDKTRTSPSKTSLDKPHSDSKTTKGGGVSAVATGTSVNVIRDGQSSSYSPIVVPPEENCKRGSNNKKNKGLPCDSGSTKSQSITTKAHVFSEQLDNTSPGNRNEMDSKQSVASGGGDCHDVTSQGPNGAAVIVPRGNGIGMDVTQSSSLASGSTNGSPQLVASSTCDPAPNTASEGRGSAWGKRSFLDAVMAQPPQKSA